MLKSMIPMLVCSDVQKSIEFYTDVLGLRVQSRMDEVGKSGWAMLKKGDVELMLASPTYLPDMPKVEGRYFQAMYYFYMDELAKLREQAMAKGQECTEIVERFYNMKEFEMADPDGHLLVFGEEVPEGEEGDFRV